MNTHYRTHFFHISGEHVVTAMMSTGRYVAWIRDEPDQLRGYGSTRLAAIAALTDANEGTCETMTPTFTKGTLVRVRTNNGGETVRRLAFNYYNTYEVHLEGGITIAPDRITSVEIADGLDRLLEDVENLRDKFTHR